MKASVHAPPSSRAGILRWLGQLWGPLHGRDPASFDAAAVERTLRALERVGRYLPWFPVDIKGLEQVPEPPVMMVMNHSGGTTIPDVWGLLVAWYRRFGVARPIHPLAHEFVVGTPLTGSFMERRGVLLAHHHIARRVLLESRHDLLILPGGDVEAWRPFRARWRVDFAGRIGYARLALETGVPVVPVAHAGAHETLVVLRRGRRIARALHLQRVARAEIFPVHLSLPWGLGIGPLPHVPLPAPLRYRVAPPIVGAESAEALDAAVRGAIQERLSELEKEGQGLAQRARFLAGTLAATVGSLRATAARRVLHGRS